MLKVFHVDTVETHTNIHDEQVRNLKLILFGLAISKHRASHIILDYLLALTPNWANIILEKNILIFDTCDVVYNWSISLLPPIVLNYLFATHFSNPFYF